MYTKTGECTPRQGTVHHDRETVHRKIVHQDRETVHQDRGLYTTTGKLYTNTGIQYTKTGVIQILCPNNTKTKTPGKGDITTKNRFQIVFEGKYGEEKTEIEKVKYFD
ncbi:hypothetical protein ACJMK2_040499 [Sinanodonta woodiana]|uniref:Uncharacterized protein n=1 Tax=Sinanodonta woodiana TaxID=1069815 RepID=A0ABD3W324_SINWO